MSDPTPSAEHSEPGPRATEREPWQPLGFDKIAAADAEAGSPSGSFDGTTYA